MLCFTIYYCENYDSPTSKMEKLKWSWLINMPEVIMVNSESGI